MKDYIECNEGEKVALFLKNFAEQNGYKVFDFLYGAIKDRQTFPVLQSSGAVYGIWAQSDKPPAKNIEEIPDNEGWYPVYWGKDIAPVSRVKAHVQAYENGNIDIFNIPELKGKILIFGAILVNRYVDFESLLHKIFHPLKGTAAQGKKSKIIKICYPLDK